MTGRASSRGLAARTGRVGPARARRTLPCDPESTGVGRRTGRIQDIERASDELDRMMGESAPADAAPTQRGHALASTMEDRLDRLVAREREATVQLRNEVSALRGDDAPGDLLVSMPFREAVEAARDRVSRDYLVALLRQFGGNVTRASDRAGVERVSLHRPLKRYGVRPDEFRSPGSSEPSSDD